MPLTLAGIPLPLCTPEVRAWAETNLPPSLARVWDGYYALGPGDLDCLPLPSRPEPPAVRIGVLQWPTGATRPAWFFAVCDGDRLDAIRSAIDPVSGPTELVIDDGRDGHAVTASVYLIAALPLTQIDGEKQLYLLVVSDRRFYLPWRLGSISATPTSWADLYDTLGTALGVTVAAEAVDADYLTPTSRWVRYYPRLPAILDAAAAAVGQRVVVALDGSVATASWETASDAADAQFGVATRSAGGRVDTGDVVRAVPESVTALFRQTVTGLQQAAPHAVTVTLADLAATGYGDAAGVPGYSASVFADLTYDGTNGADCDALAAVAAADWYGWRLGAIDAAFPGILAWEPTGQEDWVEWEYALDDNGVPFCQTRVRRGPWDWYPSGTWACTPIPRVCESGGDADGDCLTPVEVVTSVCPISDTVSTGSGVATRVVTGITVERRTVLLPAAWVPTDPACEVNPDDCCGGSDIEYVTVDCCDVPVPTRLCLRLTSTDVPCLAGVYVLTYTTTNPATDTPGWVATLPACCGDGAPMLAVLTCGDAGWELAIYSTSDGSHTTGACLNSAADTASCPPLSATWTDKNFGFPCAGACGSGLVSATVTAPDVDGNCVAPPSWNCVGLDCIDPGDGTGTYSDLSVCQAACEAGASCCAASLLLSSDVELGIANGSNGGVYDLGLWTPGAGSDPGWAGPGVIPASPGGVIYLVCTGGMFQFWWYAVDPGGPPTDPPDQAWAAGAACNSQTGTVTFGGFFGETGITHWAWS